MESLCSSNDACDYPIRFPKSHKLFMITIILSDFDKIFNMYITVINLETVLFNLNFD